MNACLSEFFQLLVSVRIKLLGDVLHPHERPPVLSPRLLHALHSPESVLNGTLTKRLDLSTKHFNCCIGVHRGNLSGIPTYLLI